MPRLARTRHHTAVNHVADTSQRKKFGGTLAVQQTEKKRLRDVHTLEKMRVGCRTAIEKIDGVSPRGREKAYLGHCQ
jgi:hypothetical protein